jgi:hypothetical protein
MDFLLTRINISVWIGVLLENSRIKQIDCVNHRAHWCQSNIDLMKVQEHVFSFALILTSLIIAHSIVLKFALIQLSQCTVIYSLEPASLHAHLPFILTYLRILVDLVAPTAISLKTQQVLVKKHACHHFSLMIQLINVYSYARISRITMDINKSAEELVLRQHLLTILQDYV